MKKSTKKQQPTDQKSNFWKPDFNKWLPTIAKIIWDIFDHFWS